MGTYMVYTITIKVRFVIEAVYRRNRSGGMTFPSHRVELIMEKRMA